jgi:antitoxin component YwqK of YwqJK toxin-antitoxin module
MSKFRSEVVFVEKNGRTLSKRTSYYENGQIAEVGIYGNGQGDWSWNIPVGVVKKYFENGQIESEIPYNDYGAREGESNFYDKKGKLIRKSIHSKDLLIEDKSFVGVE